MNRPCRRSSPITCLISLTRLGRLASHTTRALAARIVPHTMRPDRRHERARRLEHAVLLGLLLLLPAGCRPSSDGAAQQAVAAASGSLVVVAPLLSRGD